MATNYETLLVEKAATWRSLRKTPSSLCREVNFVTSPPASLAAKSPLALHAVKEAWYYSPCASPDVAVAISKFIPQRIIRNQAGRPGLEQFVQKELRPVSAC